MIWFSEEQAVATINGLDRVVRGAGFDDVFVQAFPDEGIEGSWYVEVTCDATNTEWSIHPTWFIKYCWIVILYANGSEPVFTDDSPRGDEALAGAILKEVARARG